MLCAVSTLLCTLGALLRVVAFFVMHCHLQFYVQRRVFLPLPTSATKTQRWGSRAQPCLDVQ